MTNQKKEWNEMNWIGILPVLVGVIYLIYSVLFRDIVNYYNRRFSKRNKMNGYVDYNYN